MGLDPQAELDGSDSASSAQWMYLGEISGSCFALTGHRENGCKRVVTPWMYPPWCCPKPDDDSWMLTRRLARHCPGAPLVHSGMVSPNLDLDERFTGDTLDTGVWFPFYLLHWSSRAQSAAMCEVRNSELHVSIPVDQPPWFTDTHDGPLRVSCVQTGSYSGPVGSTIGQQPFWDGLEVGQEQPDSGATRRSPG